MEKLQNMCTAILLMEKEMVKAGAEEEIHKQIERVKFKAEKQIQHTEKLMKKKRDKSQLAEDARQEGMTVKGEELAHLCAECSNECSDKSY